ncbi:bifunctional tRNA (5-methylaminomethyl-2-thiouridine)(34)-methyltransferase MnmD/FAD-dependent 5-carboxymethylaminomethyl-2-thiouridine(34) oxidoreductase MnmC [Psychromonas sp. 14N.309.X.WAT.B.A12]|uniref:bifunctional tRNA (5-methylaminomethyl-2-thiouridine)(34)-methyltransferase MnmD/FAD-dependent 5-carboxymethylaminomethyl-2-thiouridine(34) oxidoreductase MnmC n=1 Tax=Psychromonas sp. 14N.309.X.WAT.B.A12 TaxID=2998322 RepID=UPI0025B23FD8|nr:bifunctional tRNA (5-methylaminomethyl-2-thiouridine)(34)-methyltransferase MnmD/FAD-dependent 5-carboxymethylaminomethyl-2-thiouridine(34) oxidoreductase MnmC [Psychromonas sp. 14N.309.X.WAT.B.A12]MDN2662116.1 bifunctional tRNA (5-methylaminomethyl-2-thiouridine)(34)-methyltransferase MnmD/FAD-dependent 5-carboxymethylaminomethyl-2-thiouridine(34) oxidoreductase MnmC [Psychromonas sp. 14N.309.X.WAT.B.A12]
MSQDKNNIINHAQLDWSDQSEPFSTQFDDIYFNNDHGADESEYVFFSGNDLLNRWQASNSEEFCIAETGFGSGLNFLTTALKFNEFKANNKEVKLQRLHFISFELYPLEIEALRTTLSQFRQFSDLSTQLVDQYPLPLVGCHRLSFNHGQILLDLWFGDVNQQLDNIIGDPKGIVDAWYLDGFNPHKNPEMWHQVLFQKMFNLSKPEATLATFTAAGFVRRALIESGFIMSKRKGYGKKREMLVGVVQPTEVEKTKKAQTQQTDVAIIGGGIAGLCTALSLAKRDNKVTVYCADKTLGSGASGNLQGALYPLLNQQHDELSQLFANAYLYALNFYKDIDSQVPFSHQFNGLLQLAYDQTSHRKLNKINQAQLPSTLVKWLTEQQTDVLAGLDIGHQSLYYPNAGWLSPRELINSLSALLATYPNVQIHCDRRVDNVELQTSDTSSNWTLTTVTTGQHQASTFNHQYIVIAAGMDTLKFKQCRAVPLSATRGQVSHVPSNDALTTLKLPLCHEGYLTPAMQGEHCMGATFKRHDENIDYRESEQQENHQKLKKCIAGKAWVDTILTNDQAHIATRTTTRDHFPYLGELTDYDQLKKDYQAGTVSHSNLPTLPNAYLITGLGSRGLCSAPLLAEILASRINYESLPIANKIYKKMQIPRQWLNYMAKNKPLKE